MSKTDYVPVWIQDPTFFTNVLPTHYAGAHMLMKEFKSMQIGSLAMFFAEALSTLNAGYLLSFRTKIAGYYRGI